MGCPEVIVRESPDELTLRAEEVGTLKTYINVDHIEPERWVLSWLMLIGMPLARRWFHGIEGEDSENM